MATKVEIIEAIRESPLTGDELDDIIKVCVIITVGNSLVSAGMDMLAEKVQAMVEEAKE